MWQVKTTGWQYTNKEEHTNIIIAQPTYIFTYMYISLIEIYFTQHMYKKSLEQDHIVSDRM